MIKCSICGKALGTEFDWINSKYKFIKCEDCMVKATMAKANSDYKTFRAMYQTIKNMPAHIPSRRCTGCGRILRWGKYSKCSSCLNYTNRKVVNKFSPSDTKIYKDKNKNY